MGERRFLFWDIDNVRFDKAPTITESELKRRIAVIRGVRPDQILDIEIDILLYGDGEKGEDITLTDGSVVCPKCFFGKLNSDGSKPYSLYRDTIYELPDCANCGGTGIIHNYDKPSPTPSRQEWEVFAHNLANAIYFRADEPTLTKRILSMPIVPKG